MSRLATLSSKLEHYQEAIADLRSLYLARGYPEALVRSWIKEHFAKRWENRLGVPHTHDESFVLKSSFNPVWSAFNVHELGKIVTDSWLSSLAKLDALQASVREPLLAMTLEGAAPEGGNLAEPEAPEPKYPDPPSNGGEGAPADFVPMDVDDTVQAHDLTAWVDQGAPRVPQNLAMYPRLGVLLREKNASLDRPAEASQMYLWESGEGGGVESNLPGPSSRSDGRERVVTPARIPGVLASKVSKGRVVETVLDIRTVGFCDRRWMVSRKKTRNLGDILNTWKKSLLDHASDEEIVGMNVDEWQ